MNQDEDRNIRSRKDELLRVHLDSWGSFMNNSITQTAMGMSPSQISNSNTPDDGFISKSY